MRKGILLSVIAVVALPTLAEGQGRSRDDQRLRNQIRMMEGALVQAVRLGAEEVSRELEKFEPTGVTVLTGTPRARGFVLDGYGVFFDVEIPDMNQSVVWSLYTIQRDRQIGDALASLGSAMALVPEGPGRQQLQLAFQQVTKSVGPAQGPRTSQGQPPPSGQVAAASATVPDPGNLYRESVKSALVDAMLGLQITVRPDDWLTVAARAAESPLPPAGLSDSVTIVLRVKGSDLAAYWADPAKGEAIREKVKVDARVF